MFFKLELSKIESVIWDWNGTLLDDVEVNLKVINKMLLKRNLPLLTLTSYKDQFCFPVQAFQSQIGFDFEIESMENISHEYHSIYMSYEKEVGLNSDSCFILDTLNQQGVDQYILSASQKDYLEQTVNDFAIADKFQGIYGVNDIYATGKIGLGEQLIQENSLNPEKTLIVGDTLHDAEVARSLGLNHILYSGGHNSYRLLSEKSTVITSLKELAF